MKNTFFLILFLGITANSAAQSSFTVTEEPLPYHHWATSFTTDIIGLNENFVMYYWQKYIEEYKGVTYVKLAKEGNVQLESQQVQFPLLNNEEVTIYSRFTPNRSESGVLLTIWINQKDGSFISSENNKTSAQGIKDWLLKFNQHLLDLNEKLIHG